MKKTVSILIISLIINSFLVSLKIVIGIIGRSEALLADGIHSLSDLTTDIIGITGLKKAHLPPDEKHPYGHGKIEYVTSIIIGCLIFVLGLSLIFNIFKAPLNIPENIVIYVVIITIITKYILASYVLKGGKKLKNNILIASGTESKMDVISSIVVLITFLISKLSNYISIFKYADKIGAIIIGLIIIRVAVNILIENIKCVLGEVETNEEFLNKIRKIILDNVNVKEIDTLNVIKFGHYYQVILNISIEEEKNLIESHDIAHQIENTLKKKNKQIKYVTIHVGPYLKGELNE